MKLCINIVNPC